ncbi:hypothetical protein DY000_02050344 [Brassica cretica]|uniref:Uncharacterized protein n=1 Tax=Brassica cretica TaxID=69181 RepID=A0ABQ7F055_BRACR|nr:hypothetical protein DY000_02050344 [Brassica cretica]
MDRGRLNLNGCSFRRRRYGGCSCGYDFPTQPIDAALSLSRPRTQLSLDLEPLSLSQSLTQTSACLSSPTQLELDQTHLFHLSRSRALHLSLDLRREKPISSISLDLRRNPSSELSLYLQREKPISIALSISSSLSPTRENDLPSLSISSSLSPTHLYLRREKPISSISLDLRRNPSPELSIYLRREKPISSISLDLRRNPSPEVSLYLRREKPISIALSRSRALSQAISDASYLRRELCLFSQAHSSLKLTLLSSSLSPDPLKLTLWRYTDASPALSHELYLLRALSHELPLFSELSLWRFLISLVFVCLLTSSDYSSLID